MDYSPLSLLLIFNPIAKENITQSSNLAWWLVNWVSLFAVCQRFGLLCDEIFVRPIPNCLPRDWRSVIPFLARSHCCSCLLVLELFSLNKVNGVPHLLYECKYIVQNRIASILNHFLCSSIETSTITAQWVSNF